jgi:hypothetical protein
MGIKEYLIFFSGVLAKWNLTLKIAEFSPLGLVLIAACLNIWNCCPSPIYSHVPLENEFFGL